MLEKHAAAKFEWLVVLLAFELFLDSRVDVLLPKTSLQILDLPFDFEVVPQGLAYSWLELGHGWHHLCAVMQLKELSVGCELCADIFLEVVHAMSVEMRGSAIRSRANSYESCSSLYQITQIKVITLSPHNYPSTVRPTA